MMTHRDVRTLLNSALPADPDTSNWARIARRKVTRRRASGVAAVLLAVSAILPLVLHLQQERQAEPAQAPGLGTATAELTHDPSQVSSYLTAPGANPCEQLSGAPLTRDPVPYASGNMSLNLPEGAERLWLCAADSDGLSRAQGPNEPLTTGIAEILELANSLPTVDPGTVCTAEYKLTYHVVLDYPDGQRILQGERHGCLQVSDGNHAWGGGESLYQAIIAGFDTQRAATAPPGYSVDPTSAEQLCSVTPPLVAPNPSLVVQGAFCGDDGQLMGVALPDDLVTKIVTQWDGDLAEPTEPASEPGAVYLLFHDAWGSAIQAWPQDDGSYLLAYPGRAERLRWMPSEEIRLALTDVFTNHEWTTN